MQNCSRNARFLVWSCLQTLASLSVMYILYDCFVEESLLETVLLTVHIS